MPKCDFCKKKYAIVMECKCGKSFCVKDRLPEDHKCCQIFDLFQLMVTPLTPKISTI